VSIQDIQVSALDLASTSPRANRTASAHDGIPLDDVPLNAFHFKIAGLTFGAHFTEGYALGTIGYALASLNRQMPLDAFWMGMIGSSALMGIFLGSLVFGWLSDRMGRQKIFLLSFLIITAAAFAQFYVSSPAQLCALRVLIGFGMGGDFAVGHAILAEFSPRKHRGTLLGSFSVVWTSRLCRCERTWHAVRTRFTGRVALVASLGGRARVDRPGIACRHAGVAALAPW